jgi:hypothetical protein
VLYYMAGQPTRGIPPPCLFARAMKRALQRRTTFAYFFSRVRPPVLLLLLRSGCFYCCLLRDRRSLLAYEIRDTIHRVSVAFITRIATASIRFRSALFAVYFIESYSGTIRPYIHSHVLRRFTFVQSLCTHRYPHCVRPCSSAPCTALVFQHVDFTLWDVKSHVRPHLELFGMDLVEGVWSSGGLDPRCNWPGSNAAVCALWKDMRFEEFMQDFCMVAPLST